MNSPVNPDTCFSKCLDLYRLLLQQVSGFIQALALPPIHPEGGNQHGSTGDGLALVQPKFAGSAALLIDMLDATNTKV